MPEAGRQPWDRPRARLRRGLRALRRLPPNALAGVLVALAILVAIVVRLHVGSGLALAIVFNLVTATAIAFLIWAYRFLWVRWRRTRRLIEVAQRSPDELLGVRRIPHPVRIVGRGAIIEQLASVADARCRTGPRIVVGETGSGKTSVLLGLARELASRGVVPVGLPLRDYQGPLEPDLVKLARSRFLDRIDPETQTAEEADRVWRMLWQSSRLAILADDLDLAPFADPETGARRALEAARDCNAAIVVTVRGQGVPSSFERSAIVLDAIGIAHEEPRSERGEHGGGGGEEAPGAEDEETEAVKFVFERAGRPWRKQDASLRSRVRELVEHGMLDRSPIYLGIVAELLADAELPAAVAGRVHATRLVLLDAFYEGLLGGRLAPDARLRTGVRAAALADLESLAIRALRSDRGRLARPAAPKPAASTPAAVEVGNRLGVTESLDHGEYRFSHQVLNAYFAARKLRASPALRRALVKRHADAPLVQLALVLVSAGEDRPTVLELVRELLDAREGPADTRLLVAATAAEIAAAADVHDADAEIARACMDGRRESGLLTKMHAVRWVRELEPVAAAEALWSYACDEEYAVRWELVARWAAASDVPDDGEGTTRRGLEIYRALHERCFPRLLAAAETVHQWILAGRAAQLDDWHPVVLPLKHLAWVLPALRTSALRAGDTALEQRIDRDLQRVLTLEGTLRHHKGITEQRGFESSIAQGFKVDALRHPEQPINPQAETLLDEAGFWYSRLNLVHAIALRAPGCPRAERMLICGRLRECARSDPHPFVRAAARLAVRGIEQAASDPGAIHRYVWEDEGVVVGGRPDRLHAETCHLVGDIAVLLNMNEAGDRELRDGFGTRDGMPVCLSASRDRLEVFGERGGCPDACEFGICPYRVVGGRHTAHRALSRAFCRHLAATGKARYPRRWGSKVHKRALRAFWAQLEQRAPL